jgi:CP family cyanate transporter-like MFS transporter
MNVRSRHPGTVVTLSGMTQAVSYIVAAVLSFLFGVLHAASGGWTLPLVLLTCLIGGFGLAGALLASRPGMIEDAAHIASATAN